MALDMGLDSGLDIGPVRLPGRVLLAPMAGVTDVAFRHVCRAHGAAMTCTEMVSAMALVHHDEKTRALLQTLPEDRPVSVQIFGHDPAVMAEAACMAVEYAQADVLDINMGCPVGKIVKNGDGCALMQDPELAGRIVEAVTGSVSCPVTVKIRKGWDKGHVNAIELSQILEQAGASAIAVHARTRVQMYEGLADWDLIRDVKRAVQIPVIGNGDVWDADACRRLIAMTQCDGVMIGRGSFGNPWIFEQCQAMLEGREIPPLPPLDRRMDTAEAQIALSASLRSERPACLEARRHLAWYLRGVPHSAYYRKQAVQVSTLDDVHRLTDEIRKELR